MNGKITQRSAERKEKFIQAGMEIFLEKGYENTSLTDIIKKSGGSLASVYKFFENKEGLFRAIVERGFDDFRTQIDEKIDLSLSHKLEDFLIKFASIFFDIICDKETTLISRVMMSEGAKNDGLLGKEFLDQILSKIDKILIDFFEREDIRVQLNPCISPYVAAKAFAAVVREPYHYNAILLNEDITLNEKEREEHVKTSINIFLHGIKKH
nr:TetR/AcrR family transcriptional regulator [uncultured Campylobacter sp.]